VSRFYVENSVGRALTEAFNKFRRHHGWEAVFQNDQHPEMQERQENGDAWWIREVAGEGFAIISCDLAIVDNADERAAVVESRARIVGFAKADYNRWDMMRGLCRHWLSIEGHLQRPPVVLKVWAGSKAPVRLDLGDRA
jgi:PIN domain-containing protein